MFQPPQWGPRHGNEAILDINPCQAPSWMHPHERPGQYHTCQKNSPAEPSQSTIYFWEIIKCCSLSHNLGAFYHTAIDNAYNTCILIADFPNSYSRPSSHLLCNVFLDLSLLIWKLQFSLLCLLWPLTSHIVQICLQIHLPSWTRLLEATFRVSFTFISPAWWERAWHGGKRSINVYWMNELNECIDHCTESYLCPWFCFPSPHSGGTFPSLHQISYQ